MPQYKNLGSGTKPSLLSLPKDVHSKKKQKRTVSLDSAHDKAVNINFLKSQPLSTGLLKILCEEIESIYNYICMSK